ncbi:MAG: hypothetical protein FRX49_11167 [Trebouxia sp. A1-2]|nr:MAG: hypothetical protein FRX49_11167 [Trebouxia sp. A1-2]
MTATSVMQDPSGPNNLQMAHLPPAEFDYTFTDKELQDILGFMEHQAGGQDAVATPNPPPFLSASPPSGLGLQFQPHPTPVQSGGTLTPHPYDQNSTAGIKRETALSSTGFESGCGAPHGVRSTGYLEKRSSAFTPTLNPLPLAEKRSSLQQNQSTSAIRQDREPKQHISHSTVEKQRRDRINSLIDELRDLVPPSAANNSQQEGLDNKRPKHVVLSDTIALVKDLQDKARLGEVNQPAKQEDHAQALMQRSYPEASTSRSSDQSGSPRASSAPDLPLAPEGAPASSGVVVEQGESCLYVKVNCRDRRGLLGDIILALKAMPLEITTAAITTTQDGNVYDVFQVKLDDDHASWTAQDVQCQVHSNLYSNFLTGSGDKRRRLVGV